MTTDSPDTTEFPLITVTVVTYNHQDFIAACLDSIRAQNYPRLEVIISDDCSTDNTAAIIEAYDRKHPGFITSFHSQSENTGISHNCNFVLSRARGMYLVPFSGDDLMLPGKITAQLNALHAAPEAVMCFSNMEWFWSDSGKKICNHFGLLQRPSTDLNTVIGDFSIPTPSMMIRWDRMSYLRYNENIKYINDMILVIEIMLAGPVIYLPHVLVRYRKHAKALTMKNYFYEDRLQLQKILPQILPAHYHHALKRYAYIVRYAEIMTMLQKGQKKIAIGKICGILPAAFTSPKWVVRMAAILVAFMRQK